MVDFMMLGIADKFPENLSWMSNSEAIQGEMPIFLKNE